MQAIVGALQFILGKIVAGLKWIGDLVVAVFEAAWDLLRDVPAWVFEQVMEVVIAALNAIDLSSVTALATTTFGAIPAQVLEVAMAVGIGPALGIIGAALVVRMLLQLIPFVRLGS